MCFLPLSSIPQPACPTVCSTIHLLEETWSFPLRACYQNYNNGVQVVVGTLFSVEKQCPGASLLVCNMWETKGDVCGGSQDLSLSFLCLYHSSDVTSPCHLTSSQRTRHRSSDPVPASEMHTEKYKAEAKSLALLGFVLCFPR